MIIYLHGFRSAPASIKAQALKARMSERGLADRFWCGQLPVSPRAAIALAEAEIARARAAGLDPENLPVSDPSAMNFGSGGNTEAKAWKDIWGSGQGIGAVKAVETVAQRVDRLEAEYNAARAELAAKAGLRLTDLETV